MNRNLPKKGKIKAMFIALLLMATFIASLLPQVTATPTTITTITPNSGPVGTTVRVVGEIDTPNGTYKILWDGERVQNGTAVGIAVNDTFKVPLSAEGEHNVTLYDTMSGNYSAPVFFNVTTSYYVSAELPRIQEGLNTTITVGINGAEANKTYILTINVTDPTPKTYNTTITILTDEAGSGFNYTFYPANFSRNATTNYVGIYDIAVLYGPEILATGNFTVDLTDKLEYQRTETVNIRGSGYSANETVTVNITVADTLLEGYPKNITADINGVITHSWNIPTDATLGTYTVILTNATTPGTVKTPTDAQNFTVTTSVLTVIITDQPQTSYKWIETAILKFNVTHPDGTLYNTSHLGNMTVTVYYNTTLVTNISLTAENYEPMTGKWNVTWKIPKDATLGTGYNFTIFKDVVMDKFGNKGPPTSKSSTTFRVSKALFSWQIQTVNLANETLAGVIVDVYNATTNEWIDSKLTNATGWAIFLLDPGNYTFKAFWKNVEVGVLRDQIIEENKTLTLECQLTNVEIIVKDEAGALLPLINVTIMYNRTTRGNATFPETLSFETNNTGTIKLYNMFTHINYTIETRRYGFVFNTTFIEELHAQPWYNITITFPTYTMSVNVLDSKGEPLSNVQVNLMEWSSWRSVDSGTTDNQGNVNLSATFGRYKVKVYNDSAVRGHEVVLNETMVDLIEDGLSIMIHCKIVNIDLSVKAIDYFGQPVPNAMVEIERKFGQEWVEVDSSRTGLNGVASLNSIVGGDYRISIYLAGRLAGIKQLYLDNSKQILFKIDTYTVIAGYPVETSQLITYVSIVLLVVMFSLALTYRRLLRRFLKKKAESGE